MSNHTNIGPFNKLALGLLAVGVILGAGGLLLSPVGRDRLRWARREGTVRDCERTDDGWALSYSYDFQGETHNVDMVTVGAGNAAFFEGLAAAEKLHLRIDRLDPAVSVPAVTVAPVGFRVLDVVGTIIGGIGALLCVIAVIIEATHSMAQISAKSWNV